MLAATLRGHVDNRPFEQFQQTLLHAFARHVAGDGGVIAFARNLVDLIDEDNAPLGFRHVVVGHLEQACEQAFDILSHKSGLSEDGGVDDGEGHVEHACNGFGQQSLAGAGRANEDDVALLDVYVIHSLGLHRLFLGQTFIVVVYGH